MYYQNSQAAFLCGNVPKRWTTFYDKRDNCIGVKATAGITLGWNEVNGSAVDVDCITTMADGTSKATVARIVTGVDGEKILEDQALGLQRLCAAMRPAQPKWRGCENTLQAQIGLSASNQRNASAGSYFGGIIPGIFS